MNLKPAEESKAEARIDKVFSLHSFQVYEECALRRRLVDMEVRPSPKLDLPMPTLVLPENMACFLKVRKAVMKLVSEFNWSWKTALEQTMTDSIATCIESLKENIDNLELPDDVKYQTAITYYIRTECNVANPLQA